MIDLHIHSNFSDGLLSPEAIVEQAMLKGLKAISITDHDSVDANIVADEYAKKFNLEYVHGIEISSEFFDKDVHILGYFIDSTNSDLIEYAADFKAERITRAQKIIQKLHKMGVNISFNTVENKAGGAAAIGRPHIADVLVEEGFAFSFHDAFNKYLADDQPAFVEKNKISSKKAIEMIHDAGGLAFLAHPGLNVSDANIRELIKLDLDGIETMHPKHNKFDYVHYSSMTKRYGLLESGGSDCHGARFGQLVIGNPSIPYRVLDQMKKSK